MCDITTWYIAWSKYAEVWQEKALPNKAAMPKLHVKNLKMD